jgi:Fe-S-cluster containining protein
MPLRLDPDQRFSCSQCGRCCRGFDVVVSTAEVEFYRRKDAAAWFRGDGRDSADPFEPIADLPGLHRIRKRSDGACGFLSDANRCRIHETLGAAKKPLTCRLFPYSFHPTADGIVVKASFGCPTIVANTGPLSGTGESLVALEALRKEWFATTSPPAAPRLFVTGRTITARSSRLVRDNLIAMLRRDDDIRNNIRRIAATIDDLTRSRVLTLPDEDFAEYISLTVPHAASQTEAPPSPAPPWNARLLQYGFLYAVAAISSEAAQHGASLMRLRLQRVRLLAHFHGLAPAFGRVNVGALQRRRVDISTPAIRPIVFHYLRSTIETLGVDRPMVDDLNIAASFLNAATGLAKMNAEAAGKDVDGEIFSETLSQASDVSHARSRLLDWALKRLGGSSAALHQLATAN